MVALNQNRELKNQKVFSPLRSAGHFMRTATLVTGLAIAPLLVKAQVVQVLYPNDTSSAIVIRSEYLSEKKRANQVPANLEFVGAFTVYIDKHPDYELRITKDLALSKHDQKHLRQHPLLETDTHVLYYMFEVRGEYFGGLYVFRKK